MKSSGRKAAKAGLMILVSCAASAQSAAEPLEFEVASVKVNRSGTQGGHSEISPSGRFSFLNHRMDELIMWAYKIRIEYIAGPA